jgi:isopenicillin-N epimerase
MLAHWLLEPETVYLNHGTVGAPPRRVLAAQQAIRDEIERQPARFLLRELARLPGSTAAAVPVARAAARSPPFSERGATISLVDVPAVNAVHV